MKITLLISRAEDAYALRELLFEQRHSVRISTEPRAVLVTAERGRTDLIITDVEASTWAGKAFLDAWARILRRPPLVLLSARPPKRTLPPNLWCLIKPVDLDQLRFAVDHAAARRHPEAA